MTADGGFLNVMVKDDGSLMMLLQICEMNKPKNMFSASGKIQLEYYFRAKFIAEIKITKKMVKK